MISLKNHSATGTETKYMIYNRLSIIGTAPYICAAQSRIIIEHVSISIYGLSKIFPGFYILA